MNNEYDYSGLYHNDPGSAAPGAQQPGQPAQPQQAAAYPNVGSSGANTANTAPTDYTAPAANANPNPNPAAPQAGAQPAAGAPVQNANPNPNPTPHQGTAPQGGYNSSFGSYAGGSGGNGGNGGGYNGYSYASAPQQPGKNKKPRGKGKKVLLRVVACVGVAALGFGGGLAGTVVASRSGLIGGQMVVQTVERNTDTSAISQGSAGGTALSLQDISAIVQPSVVAITTEQMTSTNAWFGSYVQSGAGSGVIVSQDGYIITCAHVVSGATNISVQLSDDSKYTATVVGSDSTSDIAVLKIDATGLTPAVIGDSDALAVGEQTVAVGNPLGVLSGTVTDGIISAVNRSVKVENNEMSLIQTSAGISPGNSGGGLFNGNGELIGIVNAKSGYEQAESLAFAIPINTAMEIAQDLMSTGYVQRPVLGVSLLNINDANTAMQYGVSTMGVYVAQLTEGGGAQAAGVQLGDRIISVDDVAVSSSDDVSTYLKDKAVGDTVTLQLERESKVISAQVTLGASKGE